MTSTSVDRDYSVDACWLQHCLGRFSGFVSVTIPVGCRVSQWQLVCSGFSQDKEYWIKWYPYPRELLNSDKGGFGVGGMAFKSLTSAGMCLHVGQRPLVCLEQLSRMGGNLQLHC